MDEKMTNEYGIHPFNIHPSEHDRFELRDNPDNHSTGTRKVGPRLSLSNGDHRPANNCNGTHAQPSHFTWKNAFFDCSQNTTWHGVRFICEPTPFSLRRFVWFVLVLTGCLSLAWILWVRLTFFFSFPVQIDLSYETSGPLDFPAITFCNQNKFRISSAVDGDLYDLLSVVADTSSDPLKFSSSEFPSRNNASDASVKQVLERLGHNISDALLKCEWNGAPCGSTDFARTFTDFGLCHTFNWNPKAVKRVNGTGASYGLRLTLNTEQYEYMKGGHHSAGFYVVVHDPSESSPSVADNAIIVGPGSQTKIGILAEQVNLLPSPYGNCTAPPESGDLLRFSSFVPPADPLPEDCHLRCLSRFVAANCGCRDAYMSENRATGYPKVCSVWQRYVEGCVDYQVARAKILGVCDACPKSCQEHHFDYSVSSAALRTTVLEGVVDASLEESLRRRVRVAKEVRARSDVRQKNKDRAVLNKFVQAADNFEILVTHGLPNIVHTAERELNSLRKELQRRFKDHEYLLDAMTMIYEWFFKREVNDREARVLGQIALGYNVVLLTFEHRLRQMITMPQEDKSYRKAMLDVIEADMIAHKEIAVRGREALTYLDDCFRKEQPCYRWVPLNETMMAAIPKGMLTRESTEWKFKYTLQNLDLYINSINSLLNITRTAYFVNTISEEKLESAKEDYDRGARRYVSYKNLLLSFEYYTRGETIVKKKEELTQYYTETLEKMEDLVIRIQSQKASLESIREDILPKLLEGRKLIEEFYTNASFERSQLANYFISPDMRLVAREVSIFMAEARVRQNYFEDQWGRIAESFLQLWSVIINQENSKTYYTHINSTVANLTLDQVTRQIKNSVQSIIKQTSFKKRIGHIDTEFLDMLAEVQQDMNRFKLTSVTDSDFVKNNVVLIELFFSDKGRQIIHHREAYGLYTLLCDIGGAMGLFVGASILTTFELIDAILHHACKKVCKKI